MRMNEWKNGFSMKYQQKQVHTQIAMNVKIPKGLKLPPPSHSPALRYV